MNNNLKTLMRIIKCNQKDKKELNKILISSKLKINFLKKLIHQSVFNKKLKQLKNKL